MNAECALGERIHLLPDYEPPPPLVVYLYTTSSLTLFFLTIVTAAPALPLTQGVC